MVFPELILPFDLRSKRDWYGCSQSFFHFYSKRFLTFGSVSYRIDKCFFELTCFPNYFSIFIRSNPESQKTLMLKNEIVRSPGRGWDMDDHRTVLRRSQTKNLCCGEVSRPLFCTFPFKFRIEYRFLGLAVV